MTDVTPRFKTPKPKRTLSQYRKVRRWTLNRSGGRCEAAWVVECSGFATETHHILRRSQGGTDEMGNLLAVCHFCHAAIHAMPNEARARGLLARNAVRVTDDAVASQETP